MLRKLICLSSALLIIYAIAPPVFANGQIVFGPQVLKINRWHAHFSFHRFSADDAGDGIISITKNTGNKKIRGGFLVLNGSFIPIRNFLRGSDTVFDKKVKLRSKNRLSVFLRGTPAASIIIKISKRTPGPPIQVHISADPEAIKRGEASTLTWTSSHAQQVSIDQGLGSVPLNGAIELSPIETTTYTITAKRNKWTVTDSVTLTVVNSPPIAEPQAVSTNEDSTVSITLSASDVDEDPLTYQIVAGTSSGSLSGTPPNLTYTPAKNYNGSDSFKFKANDGLADSAPATVSITVNPANDPPAADAGPDQTVFRNDTVVLDGSGSDDVDGDSLTYLWSFVSLPQGSLATISDPALVNPGFVPDVSGTYEIQLVANDGSLASVPDTVFITAKPRLVQVPDVVHLTQIDAQAALVEAGLAIGTITTENSDTVSADHVISQSPSAGTSIEEDSPVNLVVSLGPAGPVPPIVSISAAPDTIQTGQSATLTWSSTNATNCFIEPEIGSVPVDGSTTVSPPVTTTYTIAVTGPTGSAETQVVVAVLGNPDPLPEGSFGTQYEDLIPPDATIETYDARRFALITGLVQTTGADPVSDAAVTIHKHPEYGTVTTDAQGRFSIPVEGGGPLSVVYRKNGLISAQRKVYVPWNDIAICETITMISEDTAATTITFDGDPGTVITHQSTEVSDEFGNRSCSMVFTGDNRAYLVDENGNDVYELTTITTRATEYTTPESMPAKLPPNSAYTYCVELGVDGAQRVRFEKPVVIWVDNFLGFETGTAVPVGSYDRDRGVWKPEQNGIVVKLLDTDTDGIVDALDADGDSQADDLNGNGSFRDEVTGLDDTQEYHPGATYWRVDVNHFTPYDLNWARAIVASLTPLIPQGTEGSISPNPDGAPYTDQQKNKGNDCQGHNSSFIEERSRIFHEDIPIPGTDFTLHYASNRTKDSLTIIAVPASGETVPDGLKRIIVKIKVAGRIFEQTLDPLPNQMTEFVWDGLDHLERRVQGPITALVEIGFVYDAVYTVPPALEEVFALLGRDLTSVMTRQEVTLRKHSRIIVFTKTKAQVIMVAEGWTFSNHHHLNVTNPKTLYKGDGTTTKNSSSNLKYSVTGKGNLIETVAGNGTFGFSGDGGPATEAMLGIPRGMAVDAIGNFFIVDMWYARIRKVDTNGIITTVAGGGTDAYGGWDGIGIPGEGGPATEAELGYPLGVAVDADGNLYITDILYDLICKVNAEGIITTVAGGGSPGDGFGDGLPATQAELSAPRGVAVDAWGNIYIADTNNHCIRKVAPNGTITTVAGLVVESGGGGELPPPSEPPLPPEGEPFPPLPPPDPPTVTLTGSRGFSGDGGLATEAQIDSPEGVAVDAWGNLYIADTGNYRIRKVDISGTITTVAGCDSSPTDYQDGLPATEVELGNPKRVVVDADGNLYIADSYYGRIFKVNTSGIITTVGGPEAFLYTSAGEQSDELLYLDPYDAAVNDSGDVYFIDDTNIFVGKVGPIVPYVYLKTAQRMVFTEENGIGYVMSDSGIHLTTIDLDSGTILRKFGYDQKNNLMSITDQFGAQTVIERDGNNVPTAIISPDGLTTILTIDANNHLTRTTYPDGSSYSFEYISNGLMTAKVEPEGNRFEHVFDPAGRLTNATDEEGGNWRYTSTFCPNGDIINENITGEGNLTSYLDHTDSIGIYTSTITDATGAQTLFKQSRDRMTVNKSLPCGMDFEFQYDIDPEYKYKYVMKMSETTPGDLVKKIVKNRTYQDTDSNDVSDIVTEAITVNNKTTTLVNNVLQSTKTVTSAETRTITTQYDLTTLLTESVSVPGLLDTNYEYDNRGRLTSVTTDTRQTSFIYNTQGFLETLSDPENHSTTYTYDAVGRVTGIDRPDGSLLGFTYDKNGNMTVLTNPSTIDHGFGFNKVNLNSSYQSPLSGNYSYIYDKDRRLSQTNFPSGKQINNIYVNGRLEQIQTPQGNIDVTYLCGSKVESITNGTDTITYEYDGKLVTSETLSGILNQSLSYSYNNDFNLTAFTYSDNTVNYTYDNDDLLTAAGSYTVIRNAGNGLPESVTGGALNLSRTFNGYGEVSWENYTVSGPGILSWNLTRNNSARITQKTETAGSTTSNYAYTYDPMGRLLTVTKDSTLVEEYDYDANGTRIYEMNSLRGIPVRSFSYDDEDHLLTAGTTTYQYNVDGFLTTKTEGEDITTYNYSSRGELLSVTLPDGTVIEYAHDPLGRRIAKKINETITEKYLWQGLTRLLAVYDSSDNLTMRFEYANGRMPVAMTKGTSTYYLTYDQVGSLRIVADSSGNVIKRINYDSFGNIIDDTNPSFEVPFGFAGGLHDSDTGLVRFGYRDYDPDIGRWSAKDPILFVGGDTDLYGYCLNNPINWIDPAGLEASGFIVGGISGGILGAISGFEESGVAGAAGGAILGAITGGAVGLALDPITGGKIGGAAGAAAGNLAGAIIGEMLGPSSLTPSERDPVRIKRFPIPKQPPIYHGPIPPQQPSNSPCLETK